MQTQDNSPSSSLELVTRSVGDLLVRRASLRIVGVDLAVAVLGFESIKTYRHRHISVL